MEKKAENTAVHTMHRARMKARYLHEGFDHFEPHEILEMLLYYGKPQGDTNPTAHALLEQFGTLRGVMEASVDELKEVPGVGEHTAILLKLIPEAARRLMEEPEGDEICFDSLSKIGNFICRRFIGLQHERLYMLLFNNRMNMIDCVAVSDGSVNCSNVPIRMMIEKILQKKASSVVLAHNHPNGVAIPSSSDLEVTDILYRTLETLDIVLVEHLVVADHRFFPILRKRCGTCRTSPVRNRVGSSFYESFYDLDESEYQVDFQIRKR